VITAPITFKHVNLLSTEVTTAMQVCWITQLRFPEQLQMLNHTSVPEQPYILLESPRCHAMLEGSYWQNGACGPARFGSKQGTPKGRSKVSVSDSNETLQLLRVEGAR